VNATLDTERATILAMGNAGNGPYCYCASTNQIGGTTFYNWVAKKTYANQDACVQSCKSECGV
jgi:hypothetical protein